MLFEIKSDAKHVVAGTAKDGKPFSFEVQKAQCQLNGEIRNVDLPVSRDGAVYPPGRYALADESFMVNGFGRFMLGRLRLVPIK